MAVAALPSPSNPAGRAGAEPIDVVASHEDPAAATPSRRDKSNTLGCRATTGPLTPSIRVNRRRPESTIHAHRGLETPHDIGFPSSQCGFDSSHPLHTKTRGQRPDLARPPQRAGPTAGTTPRSRRAWSLGYSVVQSVCHIVGTALGRRADPGRPDGGELVLQRRRDPIVTHCVGTTRLTRLCIILQAVPVCARPGRGSRTGPAAARSPSADRPHRAAGAAAVQGRSRD